MAEELLKKVKVVFEDEYLLAIDKPSGLVVHPDGRTDEVSLVDWAKSFFEKEQEKQEHIGNPHTLDSGRYHSRWGIVNRLDRETSGIILIAKTDQAFSNLQKQFIDGTVEKEYLAKVWGAFFGVVNVIEPISRHKKDPRIWVCGQAVGERLTKRNAETKILSTPHVRHGDKTSLVRLYPMTGRTHQLRLHTRFLGHPIVGDKKYGIDGIINEHSIQQIDVLLLYLNKDDFETNKNSRLMLHAKSLKFIHPETNELIKIETETPLDFNLKA